MSTDTSASRPGPSPEPRATVLMPVYNAARYLRQAIDSVLGQTLAEFEFLIVDDGSTDDSVAIVKSYADPRIRLLSDGSHRGLVHSLNWGIEAARGRYLIRQDADDVLRPERAAIQVAYLDAHPDVVVVGSWIQLIDEHGTALEQWRYPVTDDEIRWASFFNTAVAHSSATFRTETARVLGGYSPDLDRVEDFDLWSRMSTVGELANIPDVLQLYRVHATAVSTVHRSTQAERCLTVASRNIRVAMADRLSDEAIRYVVQYERPTNAAGLILTLSAYEDILRQFSASRVLSPAVKRRIRLDIVNRMSVIFQSVRPSERLACIAAKLSFFPAEFWLTGRWISMVLSDQTKRSLRRLVRRSAMES